MAGNKKSRKAPVAEFKADYRADGHTPVEKHVPPAPAAEEITYTADYRSVGENASLDSSYTREPESFDEVLNSEEPEEKSKETYPWLEDEELATEGDILTEEDVPEEQGNSEFSKERAQQLGNFLSEQRPYRRRGRHRYGVAVGSVVLLLALVGVVFLAVSAGKVINHTATDDSALRSYDKWLAPVVMQDPAPFESIDQADPDMVMTASLWSAISTAGQDAFTTYDDQGRTLVPLGEVDRACKALFGPDCTLQARTPKEETFFTFDTAENQFHVAPFSTQTSYQPYTESARRSDDSELLRVGYVPPVDDSYGDKSAEARPQPVKYMEYVLKTNLQTGEKYISAIRAVQ